MWKELIFQYELKFQSKRQFNSERGNVLTFVSSGFIKPQMMTRTLVWGGGKMRKHKLKHIKSTELIYTVTPLKLHSISPFFTIIKLPSLVSIKTLWSWLKHVYLILVCKQGALIQVNISPWWAQCFIKLSFQERGKSSYFAGNNSDIIHSQVLPV